MTQPPVIGAISNFDDVRNALNSLRSYFLSLSNDQSANSSGPTAQALSNFNSPGLVTFLGNSTFKGRRIKSSNKLMSISNGNGSDGDIIMDSSVPAMAFDGTGNFSVDFSQGTIFTGTLTGNRQMTIANPQNDGRARDVIVNTSGSYGLTYAGTSIYWMNGNISPTFAAPGGIITFIYDGSTLYAQYTQM